MKKKALRAPYLHAAVIGCVTLFYAGIFLVTSGHIEFQRTLYKGERWGFWPEPTFWSGWSDFLYKGYQSYIALIFLALAGIIIVLILTEYKRFDEYQIYTFQKCFMAAGLFTMAAIAFYFGSIMSVNNGALEKLTLLVIVHWSAILLADLFYVLWSLKGSYRAIWNEDVRPVLRSFRVFWIEVWHE